MTSKNHKSTPQHPYQCSFPPPARVWELGRDGWHSRAWKKGEKAKYAFEVLGQVPE